MIEQLRLKVRAGGFVERDFEIAWSPEINLVVGENNAGKTRWLRAIAGAQLVATINQVSIATAFQRGGDATIAAAANHLHPICVQWPRDPLRRRDTGETPPDQIVLTEETTALLAQLGSDRAARCVHMIRNHVWDHLPTKPSQFVQTDRYLESQTTLGGTFEATSANPADWTSALVNLAQNVKLQQQFEAISGALSGITGGVRLKASRQGQEGSLYVQGTSFDRELKDCGDGLRDLIGILFFVVTKPGHDLFIDEPGLRLHPSAQRRLLEYVHVQASTRQVWIASHDGVFVGAPMAARRYQVSRHATEDVSIVTSLLDRNATASAMIELGWEPRDAFLADRVLLVEGESDKLVFERAVSELEARDATWGGTLVSHLGGTGAVWDAERKLLKERIDLVKRIVPGGRCAVLLDRDGRSPDEVNALAASLVELGIPLRFLSKDELEDFWLDLATLERLFTGLAADACSAGQNVALPTMSDLQAAFSETSQIDRASKRLEKMARILNLRFDKVPAARHAIKGLSAQSSAMTELCKEVRGILDPPRGAAPAIE